MSAFQSSNTVLWALCLTVTGLLASGALWAQSSPEPLNSDRPDQSEGPFVLPRGMVQIESGTLLEGGGSTAIIQNTMLRVGINGSTEVRLLIDAGHNGSEWALQPVGFSLKQKLIKAKEVRPDVALVAYVYAHPLATGEHRQTTVSSVLVVAAENAIGNNFSVTYTAGGSFSDLDLLPTAILTTQALYRPKPNLGVFVEYFAHVGTEVMNGVDAGIMFHPMPSIMLDFAGAAMHTASGWGGYATIGLCWRFSPCIPSRSATRVLQHAPH